MDKSLYSLILIDDVVKQIDQHAHEKGVSRSALINRILAEYVNLITPEKRIQDIFEEIIKVASQNRSLKLIPASNNMLSMKSVINYKYNPTIKYSVEISDNENGYTSEFRVVSRSQSEGLILQLNEFFKLWIIIENDVLKGKITDLSATFTDGKYKRTFRVEQNGKIYDSDLLGKAISSYIQAFDKGLRIYFSSESEETKYHLLIDCYQNHIDQTDIII